LLSLDTLDAEDTANVEVVARFRSAVVGAGGYSGGLAVRASGAAGAETGYALLVTSTEVTLGRFQSGTFTALKGAPYTLAANTWTWIRLRANGTTIQARAWADGAAEPTTWQVEHTGATIT